MHLTLHPSEIYAAIDDDAALEQVFERLTLALGARSMVAGWIYNDGSQAFLHQVGFDPDAVSTYLGEYGHLDPWTDAQVRNWRPNVAADLSRLVPDREFESSILYNEFLRPFRIDIFRCLSLPAGNIHGKGAIAFHRGRQDAAFEPEQVRLLGEVAGPLTKTLSLRARLSGLERNYRGFAAMADAAPHAMMIVNRRGMVAQANSAAEAVLSDRSLFQTEKGRLRPAAANSARLCQSILELAAGDGAPLSALVERPNDAPLLVSALPKNGIGAIVLLQDFPCRDATLLRRLQTVFRLSSAEAEIAARIAAGESPEAIAELRSSSIQTVRTQVKSVAQKLDVRRQSEIAATVRAIIPINL